MIKAPTIEQVVARYHQAKASWEAVFDRDFDNATNCIEWRELEKVELDIAAYPCHSMTDIACKAQFFLEIKDGVDSLGTTITENGEVLLAFFLRSIATKRPVDNGESGENRT